MYSPYPTQAELRQKAREERSSWNLHRARVNGEIETEWLNHVASWTDKNGDPIRASSDSVKVRQQLLDAGVLFPLSDRPTLRLDDAARLVIAEPWRAWSAEELLA